MRRPAGIVLALLLCVVIAAISLASRAGPSPDTRRELVYAGLGDPQEVEIIKGVLRGFEREHPEYRVRFVHIPGAPYWTKLKIMFAGGVAPDVMYMGGGYVQELAAGGQLMEVNDAARRFASNFPWDQFVPEGLDMFRQGDGLYGVPRDVAPIAVFYNQNLFDAANVAYPKPGWTRDQFIDTATKLTKPELRQYGIHVRVWNAEYLPAIWSSGGRVMDDRKTRVVIDSPEAIDGLRFFRDLIFRYRVAPNAAEQEGTFPLFNAGRAAMTIGGYWSVAERRKLAFRWSVAPVPRQRYGTTCLFGAGYSIAKNTKDPEGAWKLVEYMTSAPVQRQVALLGLAVPARNDALTPADLAADPILAAFVDCLNDCRPPPFVPRWKEVDDTLNRHVQRMLLGITAPEGTAAGIKRDVGALLGGQGDSK